MIDIEEQIRLIEGRKDICESVLKSIDVNDFFRGIHTNDLQVLNAILETLKSVQSNGNVLPANRKQCPACSKIFTPKNNLQECCSSKCRVRLHRNKNKLKNFNQKVNDILKAKDPEAKFTVEQLISSEGECPFIVDYKGMQYQSDSTRNLLTQLKKI